MIHRLSAAVALLIGTLALAGCGGGGGGGSAQPISNTAPIRDAIGGGSLNLSNAQIRQALAAIERQTDSVNVSDDTAVCSGTSCRTNNVTIYLSDFNLANGTYAPVMTHNGMNIMQGANRVSFAGQQIDYQTYGGWGDHSLFGVFAEDDTAFAATAGDDTGSRPISGSASWRGVMVGADFARDEGFQGDATITADFAASHVDVAFTNIHEVMTGSRRNDIRFNNVPFTSDGFSSGSRVGRFVDGTFYGPNHAEAGGVFETEFGNKFGSFGAKRQ